jgi:hypothetical protein
VGQLNYKIIKLDKKPSLILIQWAIKSNHILPNDVREYAIKNWPELFS